MSPSIMPSKQVVVITGANSGVGLSIAQRLFSQSVEHQQPLTLVLACRNLAKGKQAAEQLRSSHPSQTACDIDLLQIDTSSVESVLCAAREIQGKYSRLDRLFCNAGAMAIDRLDFLGIFRGLLTHPISFFESSEAMVQRRGLVTKDGLGLTFQTNVFGHYLLVHRLESLMETTGGARVIWTGSSASQLEFMRTDYQHVLGDKPYESSKYIVDQISLPMDQRLSKRGIRCYVAEPGNVCSNFLSGLNHLWLQALIYLVFYFCRVVLGIPRFTISPENGCEASCFLAGADQEKELLDSRLKYYSQVSRLGKPSVAAMPLAFNKNDSAFLVAKLDGLVQRFDKQDGVE
ncbi:hypothetical protein LPJ56_000166 [Coemansia sp. RSA 2599]|nr:hypothetical protein LPJ75_000026 [Coemansia sp. RSA 2598]KAJ1829647.1 hypothetical protein LPJ56_000166 [Coemansia sp. RSA 2599]